jgi:hypothetical protein
MRFIYYGASVEFFFVVFTTFLVITRWASSGSASSCGAACAGWRPWPTCRPHRGLGGPLMVLIQVMIVFLQRIFRVAEIELGPMGTAFAFDLSWWAEG